MRPALDWANYQGKLNWAAGCRCLPVVALRGSFRAGTDVQVTVNGSGPARLWTCTCDARHYDDITTTSADHKMFVNSAMDISPHLSADLMQKEAP